MSISVFGYVVVLTLLLAAGAAAIEWAIQGHGAARHVWSGAIVLSLIAPPAALAWHVRTQLHLMSPAGGVSAGALKPIAGSLVGHGVSSAWTILQQALTRAAGAGLSATFAMGAWILASVVLLGWVGAGAIYWSRASRSWRRSTLDGVDVDLAPSTGPAVLGVLSHRIVIPEWAVAMPPEDRRLVLAHESEHVRSRDPERLAIAMVALILTPWNVALWWCAARLRRAIELDCDARVLRIYPDARKYGYVLLEVAARGRNIGPLAIPMVALLRMPSDLERRLRAISRPHSSERRTAVVGALSVAVLASVAFTTPVPLLRPIVSFTSSASA
ncbi:MAG TPA: M56 family metallopeptidase, partial [Gemmatimonadaceae bacterium]